MTTSPPPIGAPVATVLPRPWPTPVALAGRFVRLDPLDVDTHAADLAAAFAGETDDDGWRYLPYGPFADVAGFTDWLRQQAAAPDPQFHTVTPVGAGPAGLASLMRIQPQVGVIEIGHLHFASTLQRRPAATEAIALLMAHIFDTLGYRRCEWKCDALNARSCRAARRFGFTYEGTFRQATVVKGRNRDTAWFSVIDTEWPALRTGFAAWLSAENFDAAGQQRRTLAACRTGATA